MKTQFLLSLLIISVVTVFSCPAGMAQNSGEDSTVSALNYDVQRVYDKEGNLIYYDSTVVGSYPADTCGGEFDSLVDAWKEQNRRMRYSIRFPSDSFSYSFELPDKFFEFAPEYEFDIEIPDVDSLLRGLDYYFSLSPTDSLDRRRGGRPFFEYHGRIPGVDPDLDQRIWEMERRMRQFHDRIIQEYDSWIEEQPEQLPEEDEEPQEEPELPENENAPPPPKIDV